MKRLYARELPDSIRVRALVGLCKMGAQSGGNTKVDRMAVSCSTSQGRLAASPRAPWSIWPRSCARARIAAHVPQSCLQVSGGRRCDGRLPALGCRGTGISHA